MIIDLACGPVLPLDFKVYAQELQKYLSDWAVKHDPAKKRTAGLFALLENMERAAARIRPLLLDSEEVQKTDPDVLRRINRLLLGLERDFTDPAGIPRRPWYKHLIFGARYTYAVLLLPALTEASEAGDERGVDIAIKNLERAVSTATAKLEKIRAFWKE
jgi:N-acetylated-alpha-linked acidic dipeptidase